MFRGNIDQTSQKCIFLGSLDNSKTHLIGIKDAKGTFNIRKSRNLTFNKQKINKSLSAGQKLQEAITVRRPESCSILEKLIIDNNK